MSRRIFLLCCAILFANAQLLILNAPFLWKTSTSADLSTIGTLDSKSSIIISTVGTYTVTVSRDTSINTLILGSSPGVNPTLFVAPGVTLSLNALKIQSGSIVLAPGANLTINAVEGLIANGVIPVAVRMEIGSSLTTPSITVTSPNARVRSTFLTKLTIDGTGTLDLQRTTINAAQANIAILSPLIVGVDTKVNTSGSTLTAGSVVTVNGDVTLATNLIVKSGATLLFNKETSGLHVNSAVLMAESNIVVAASGNVASLLSVDGSLNVQDANLSINNVDNSADMFEIASFGSLNGRFVLSDPKFQITTTSNQIIASRK